MQRFDRGAVLAPPGGSVFEGVAGRAHAPGDALEYETGPEHRDASELAGIARQLAAGVPVTWTHPRAMPAERSGAVIVGRTIGARVDGDHVVAKIRIDDQQCLPLIRNGTKALSLGYETDLVTRGGLKFQTNLKIDHLAIVSDARCGAACAMRADQLPRKNGARKMCSCSDNPERVDAPDPEAVAKAAMTARSRTAWRDDAVTATGGVTAGASSTPEEIATAGRVAGGLDPELRRRLEAQAASVTAWISNPAERKRAANQWIANTARRIGGVA